MYGQISLQQSIELLWDYGQKGSFIIRKDLIENMHWLSFVRSDQQIIHWPIEQDGDDYHVDGNERIFESLQEIVECMKSLHLSITR